VATIFAALGMGALVYAALVLLLDEPVRAVVRVVWQKVRSRSA
jgi:ABC-type branched-subunit amino acid transport system ATPase component